MLSITVAYFRLCVSLEKSFSLMRVVFLRFSYRFAAVELRLHEGCELKSSRPRRDRDRDLASVSSCYISARGLQSQKMGLLHMIFVAGTSFRTLAPAGGL